MSRGKSTELDRDDEHPHGESDNRNNPEGAPEPVSSA
jgi:hypothetical protein